MHPNNEAQLYGLVEPNVHQQVLASSSQVDVPLSLVYLGSLVWIKSETNAIPTMY